MDVTEGRRRAIVQALLSPPPPDPLLPRSEGFEGEKKGPSVLACPTNDKVLTVKCSLCLCSQESQFSKGDGPASFVSSVMKLLGLDFGGEDEKQFCDFCSTHLKNYIKKDMDALGQRLSSMVYGLHAVFTMPTGREEILIDKAEDKTQPSLHPDGEEETVVKDDKEVVDLDSQMMDTVKKVTSQKDTNGDPRSGQSHSEIETLTAVEAVLKNLDLVRIILAKIIHEHRITPAWSSTPTILPLRLVCREFNNAILTMPYPPPITLDLNRMFPDNCEEDEDCLNPTPVPLEEIPELQSTDLCRTVSISLEQKSCCWGHPAFKYEGDLGDFPDLVPLEGITFLNFCSVYGNNVRRLALYSVTEEFMPPLTATLDRHCLNLRDLSISICDRECESENYNYSFCFSTNENLKKLKFDMATDMNKESTCPVMQAMAKAIIEASPNLDTLDCSGHMFFDLSKSSKLSNIVYSVWPEETSFTKLGFVNMLSSSASGLDSLKLKFCNTSQNIPPEIQAKIGLTFFPQLRKLEVFFMRGFRFGSALVDCIFSPRTPQLQSLTIDSEDQEAIQNFLLLIRDNFHRYINKTVKKFELKGRLQSGISNISHLTHLKTAFPNLKILKLTAGVGRRPDPISRGAENLRDVFSILSLWKELDELELKLNFPLTFSNVTEVLASLGEEFWTDGCLRKLKLEVEHFLFPHPNHTSYYHHHLSDFREVLLTMKCLERVKFKNFTLPAGLTQEILSFISENDLQVSFLD